MLKFCRLEDKCITYPKSIGSLDLFHTDAKISVTKTKDVRQSCLGHGLAEIALSWSEKDKGS